MGYILLGAYCDIVIMMYYNYRIFKVDIIVDKYFSNSCIFNCSKT